MNASFGPRRRIRPLVASVLMLAAAGCGPGDRMAQTTATEPPEASSRAETGPSGPVTLEARPTEEAAPSSTRQFPRIGLERIADGLDAPLFVTHAGDGSGRLYGVEKGGRILALDPDSASTTPDLVLDLGERIDAAAYERGLLGLAFHPDIREAPRLFVNYTDLEGNTRVSEFAFDAISGKADVATERVLLNIPQPAANHNGGHIAFGPEGYLYVATGDGGAADDRFGNGQNPGSLLAKILRIDIDRQDAGGYGIPADNPYVGQSEFRPETLAWGLRNPWRFSFDRADGSLFVGDVGQNRWEEIDRLDGSRLSQGGNFGWPIFEGDRCFNQHPDCDQDAELGLSAPILVYGQVEGPGCSVTGGYVARGADLSHDSALYGTYLYGDFCSGRIWGGREQDDGSWASRLLLETELAIASFGEDEVGRVYVCDLSGGAIYRIVER